MFLKVAGTIGRGGKPAWCAALALAMGLGFTALGCGDSSEPSGSQVESAPPGEQSATSGMVETGRAAAQQVGEQAERAATEARAAAGAAAEELGEQAERVQKGAEGMAEDAGQKAQGLMDRAQKAAEEESGSSQ